MAIAFRASTGASVDPAATSIALSNPTGTANDDVLVVAVVQYSTTTPTITAGTGWTQIGATTRDSNVVLSLWWRRWQTGDPTSHTFTSTVSGRWVGAIAGYSDVHITAAIHTYAIAVEPGVGGLTHTSPDITTSVDTWLLNVFCDSQPSSWTPPVGETERQDRRTNNGTDDVSLEFCDSNAVRTSGSQLGKTATATSTSSAAVMAQLALEPAAAPPPTGNGTRTAKARIFRSTQTSPNAGTVRDLTTAYGTAANTTTTAAYATGGTVTWRRWNPHSSTTTAVDPAGVTTASGQGWRDTTAEHADESVIYNAGNWTPRVRVSKSGQAVSADITVRVVAIVYRVSSSGTHLAEIGRVQMPDDVIDGFTSNISGSFTTTVDTTFAAGDKVQVECYVTPITAGTPTAPASAVNIHFVVDETSANDGASFSAIPAYRIAYARSQAVSTAPTAAMARLITAARSFALTTAGTTAAAKQVTPLPMAVTTAGTAATVRSVGIARAVTTTGTTAITRAVALSAMAVSTAVTAAMERTVTAARSFALTSAGVVDFVRSLVFGRHFTTTTTPTTSGRVDMPIDALNRIVATTPDWPLNTPTKAIAGVTRDSVGGIVGSATVKLIRQSDDVRVATATSDAASGAYSFTRGGDDPNSYYVLAYKEDVPEVHGVTDRGLVPA